MLYELGLTPRLPNGIGDYPVRSKTSKLFARSGNRTRGPEITARYSSHYHYRNKNYIHNKWITATLMPLISVPSATFKPNLNFIKRKINCYKYIQKRSRLIWDNPIPLYSSALAFLVLSCYKALQPLLLKCRVNLNQNIGCGPILFCSFRN